ncbi:hypothetical protein ACFFRR_010655 [Megaselia abdita]
MIGDKLPFTRIRIRYNSDVSEEERASIFKSYGSHPLAVSSCFEYTKKTSFVEYSCPSVVAEFIYSNEHKSVRLSVDIKDGTIEDPRTLYVIFTESPSYEVLRDIKNLGGEVLFSRHNSVLCSFEDLRKCSRAFVELKSKYRTKFAKARPIDKWKITQINDFGNKNYKPPEPPSTQKPVKGEKVEMESSGGQTNLTSISRLTFYVRIPKDGNTEVMIETVFKSLQGFELCKKFKYDCDDEHVYYKMKFGTAENITNAVTVMNTFGFKKELKMGEDFYYPVVQNIPPQDLNDEVHRKFDIQSMIAEFLESNNCSKRRKVDDFDIKQEIMDVL